MRHLSLLMGTGAYLAVHRAQKLFRLFGGYGLEATAAGFESMGLRPGKAMVAGASELGGGVLTATGIADPLGPVAIAGTMAVAASVHRKHGPLAQKGGFELPLTNFALAVGLMSSPGRLRIGPRLAAQSVARLAVIGDVGAACVAIGQILRAQPAAGAAEAPAPVNAEVQHG